MVVSKGNQNVTATIHSPPPARYHLVGVAGTGMNALAQVLLAAGHAVSGSDRYVDEGRKPAVVRQLCDAGLRLAAQDGTGVSAATTALVHSAAVEPDNADLAAAQRLGVPVLRRSEMLARLTCGRRLVGIAGTSGKTTVTGMLGWVLTSLGCDPTVVNGGALLDWATDRAPGNVRIGASDLWVLELDESDRSLPMFRPHRAIITNISADHFEEREARELFETFAGQVAETVIAPLAEQDPRVRPGPRDGWWTVECDGAPCAVPLPGRHNACNALQCLLLCRAMGLDVAAAATALSRFRGIARRIEQIGQPRGITVVDDYAHNPAKIRASWSALRALHPRVIAVWRPHGFGPLRLMLEGLTNVFAELCGADDRLFLLPAYYAGGTADRSIDADVLAERLRKRHVPVAFAPDYETLGAMIKAAAAPGDLVLIMGARDPDLPRFARRLLVQLAQ